MSDSETLEFDQLCQDYITGIYQGVSGFISYQPGEKEAHAKEKIFLTYGEILYPSVNKIIDYIDIHEDDVFYDLGSGVGKVALHFFLKTPIKKAMGIEFAAKRNHFAEKVYAAVKREFPELYVGGRELKSMQGNFLTTDITDANIIYTCSTCFNEELLVNMGELFDTLPKLKYVISMKPIPFKLPLDTILEIECTWDKTKCHVYSRNKLGGYTTDTIP